MATKTRAAMRKSPAPELPVQVRSSIVHDPKPRKNPPRGAAASDLDIPSDRPRDEEDDDEDEENDDDGEEDEDGKEEVDEQKNDGDEQGALVQVGNGDEQEALIQVDEEDVQFMLQHLDKIPKAALDLFSQYRVFGDTEKFARRTFELALDALRTVRKHFIVDDSWSPFLPTSWLNSHAELSATDVARFKEALILANLATLLEIVYCGAQDQRKASRLADADKLALLDTHFNELLLGDDDLLPHATQTQVLLALDIRAARLLAALASAKTNQDAYTMAYDVFCVPQEGLSDETLRDALGEARDDAHRKEVVDARRKALRDAVRKGPYRPVAGLASDEAQKRCCWTRVAKFLKHFGQHEAAFANISLFRTKLFPAHDLLVRIQAVALELDEALRRNQQETPTDDAGAEEFHDAPEDADDDGDDDDDDDDDEDDQGESQPIVRLASAKAGTSLFRDASDIQTLMQAQRGAAAAPPPSNQHIGHGILPVDHGAAALSTHSSRQRPVIHHSSLPFPQRNKRSRDQVSLSDDDDDDDDEFESDRRTHSELARLEKRRQRNEAQHLLGQRSQVPSARAPTAAAAAAATTRPVTVVTHTGRRRYPWSAHDEAALIALVAEHYGKWSTIERCQDRFQHPRDQQAYRDKARNIKVDLLIHDLRLPPGFDVVALGIKEREKVRKHGKNPRRREEDVDAAGRPTNTAMNPMDTP